MKRQHIVSGALVMMLCLPVVMKMTRSETARVVEIDKVAQHAINTSILASGALLYEEQVVLSPEVIGKVSGIYVREGQQVKKGDLVLHLDDRSYRAEVAQREAAVLEQRIAIEQQQLNVMNLEKQFKRKVELHNVKFIADAGMEDANYDLNVAKIGVLRNRATLKEAEAMLTQSNELLAKTVVHAPISGTVTTVNIKTGETAVSSLGGVAGSNLMTIANTSTMITEVTVDEADIAKVAVGQSVTIYSASHPDVAIEGEVMIIPLAPKQNAAPQGQAGVSQARSYSVKVKLVDTKGVALRPGMTCRAEIFTAGSGKLLALPLQAVLSNNDENADQSPKKQNGKAAATVKTENYVFVDHNGKAEKRIVTVGISDDSYQEVRGGVSVGEAVITGPYKILRHLKPGDRVDGRVGSDLSTLEKQKI